MIFRRRGKDDAAATQPEEQAGAGSSAPEADESPLGPPLSPRPIGPFDASEVHGDIQGLDLGPVIVPAFPIGDLRIDVDPDTAVPMAVTAALPDAGVQVMAFAAPKSFGIWIDSLNDIASQATTNGQLVDRSTGPFGPEVKTKAVASDGSLQAVRFVGIDGPRWLLRLAYIGKAADDRKAAEVFDEFVHGIIVRRDNEARAPGDHLPLVLPEDVVAQIENDVVD